MSRRTYENDAFKIEIANDLDEFVKDKRKMWRANNSKANQRQRRYKKRLVRVLLKSRIYSK
tara:strand:- start:6504 stop:6686 length:183 start_codon:yes stop_codon:yes gene_type:complete